MIDGMCGDSSHAAYFLGLSTVKFNGFCSFFVFYHLHASQLKTFLNTLQSP